MQSTRVSNQRYRSAEGSAFVISILILFVLTVLGMALMLTTMTEKDIAINHRWGEQAFFNADAALEYGKNILAEYALNNGDFNQLLPPPRSVVTVADDNQPWGEAMSCTSCGKCVQVCPTGALFSKGTTVAEMEKRRDFLAWITAGREEKVWDHAGRIPYYHPSKRET